MLDRVTTQVELANDGELFWRASIVSAGDAYMRGHEPLVQENVTVVDGQLVVQVPAASDSFAVSPSGRYFLGRVGLQGGVEAILSIDFGLVRELQGCSGRNQGSLRLLDGAARVGQTIHLGLEGGPAPGALAFLHLARRNSLVNGCGQATVHGELLLAPPLLATHVLPPWDGTNPSEIQLVIPSSLALVGASFHAQGMFGIAGRFRSYRLTNALAFELGPP